jgi:hypothetical protein
MPWREVTDAGAARHETFIKRAARHQTFRASKSHHQGWMQFTTAREAHIEKQHTLHAGSAAGSDVSGKHDALVVPVCRAAASSAWPNPWQ